VKLFSGINAIPDSLKSITKVAEEDEKKWLYHRIVVTTSSQSGIIFRYKISPSHFTHVFIDEAAQCLEPESLIPISMSVIGHGCVVLAGDHQQLGPVIMSTIARNYRLNCSLMERLMTCCKPYERSEQFSKYGFYNPKFVTKLITNYRSDSKIMSIPSKLFYDNELNCVNLTDSQLIKSMNFKSPVVFTGVRGERVLKLVFCLLKIKLFVDLN
jgi:superfamily I DNA and/or RNA helicase